MATQKLNGQEIIDGFHRYVDDDTELSPAEDYALLQKKYNELANDRGWEWCRKQFSQAITSGQEYIELPEDFRFGVEDEETEMGRVFFIGTNRYPIFPYGLRRTRSGNAYFDAAGTRIYLPSNVVAGTMEFDYYGAPENIELDGYPAFRGGFHPILIHMMALDFEIIEKSEKARSYRAENQVAYEKYFEDMAYEDSEQKEWQHP